MDVVALIERKRDGGELEDSEIRSLIESFARDQIPDYQMAAWAMAVVCRGMTPLETAALTRAMRDSGECLTWPADPRPLIDKHSTGGIGDKVSLLLAPLLAACGARVPMISGRGLGATGGTLDKLESYQNLRVGLSTQEFQDQVQSIGCAIVAASAELAPADRRLYALRDVTGTVPSVPLITASILSKKLAENPRTLVLDVKVGSGAFMKDLSQARELAQSLVRTATRLGTSAMAWITDMNQPLGRMVGNACEVIESRELLRTPDYESPLCQLVVALAAEGLVAAGAEANVEVATERVKRQWDQGDAYECFARMIAAQGGAPEQPLSLAPSHVLVAPVRGWVEYINGELLGRLVIAIGGGRQQLGDSVDHGVGLQMHVGLGSQVEPGQPLLTVFSREPLSESLETLAQSAFHYGDMPSAIGPLFLERIDHSSASSL